MVIDGGQRDVSNGVGVGDAAVAAMSGVTREGFLRRGAAGALVLGGAGLLGAGCGGSSSSTSSAAVTKPKKGGTLRIGLAGGSSADDFDAAHEFSSSETVRQQAFYETLTYLDGHFHLDDHFLCEEVSPNSTGDRWTVRVKPDIEFHNGKTLGADDVLFTIKRLLDPKIGSTAGGQLTGIDLSRTRKVDSRTVEFALHQPFSVFDSLLSDVVYAVPVGYDPKNPVSTGPWVFKSYQPGRQTVLERFANYHGTPAWADQLVIVDLPDATARVNALISGQVDAINQVPYPQITQLQSNPQIHVNISPSGSWAAMDMRVDTPPFTDVRVRQALRLIMDRKQVIETAFFGQGVPAADTYGRYDPSYDPSFVRDQDIEQAKSLLKQAGKENLSIQLTTSPAQPAGLNSACQIWAENAKAAGVTMNVRLVDHGTWVSNYGKWPLSVDLWQGFPFLITTSIADGPTATFVNATHFNDREYNSLYYQACRELDFNKRTEVIHEMQRIQYERGGYVIYTFANIVDAYSTKLGGIQPIDYTGWGLGRARLDKLYFT